MNWSGLSVDLDRKCCLAPRRLFFKGTAVAGSDFMESKRVSHISLN